MAALVSVIISDLFERHLPETLVNLRQTADEPIEIIVKIDDDSKGMRYHLNEAAAEAQGKYLFKIDGHCIMTPHWDSYLKMACQNANDMVVSRIRGIDEKNWVMQEIGFSFVTIRSDLSIVSCGDFVPDDPVVSETMASIGCGWMIHKDRYMELEGCWEELGRYGNLGLEWALKIWLSGGRLLVSRQVTCGHLFRTQCVRGVGRETVLQGRQILGSRFSAMQGPDQIRPMQWLAERFHKINNTEEKVPV